MIPIFLLIVLMNILTTINAEFLTTKNIHKNLNRNSKNLLEEAKFNFSLNVLDKSMEMEPNDNLFFSPHSLYEALSLAYFGAHGDTEESLKKVLKIPKNLIKFNEKHKKDETGSNYEYRNANRLYISKRKTLKQDLPKYIRQLIRRANFERFPGAVRTKINEFVSNTTSGFIKNFIPAGAIDQSTDLVLINAVYFKGSWSQPFDRNFSFEDTFFGTKNSKITFMFKFDEIFWERSDEFRAFVVQLPYAGDEISMFIFLPFPSGRKVGGKTEIKKLIEKMTKTESGIQELRRLLTMKMEAEMTYLTIPRFSVEKELPADNLLKKIGAGDLLTSNAELTGFVENSENLHLNNFIHKAKIEVNERGSVAAAATAGMSDRSLPAEIKVNRPFVYLIYNKKDRNILFAGIYQNPEESV